MMFSKKLIFALSALTAVLPMQSSEGSQPFGQTQHRIPAPDDIISQISTSAHRPTERPNAAPQPPRSAHQSAPTKKWISPLPPSQVKTPLTREQTLQLGKQNQKEAANRIDPTTIQPIAVDPKEFARTPSRSAFGKSIHDTFPLETRATDYSTNNVGKIPEIRYASKVPSLNLSRVPRANGLPAPRNHQPGRNAPHNPPHDDYPAEPFEHNPYDPNNPNRIDRFLNEILVDDCCAKNTKPLVLEIFTNDSGGDQEEQQGPHKNPLNFFNPVQKKPVFKYDSSHDSEGDSSEEDTPSRPKPPLNPSRAKNPMIPDKTKQEPVSLHDPENKPMAPPLPASVLKILQGKVQSLIGQREEADNLPHVPTHNDSQATTPNKKDMSIKTPKNFFAAKPAQPPVPRAQSTVANNFAQNQQASTPFNPMKQLPRTIPTHQQQNHVPLPLIAKTPHNAQEICPEPDNDNNDDNKAKIAYAGIATASLGAAFYGYSKKNHHNSHTENTQSTTNKSTQSTATPLITASDSHKQTNYKQLVATSAQAEAQQVAQNKELLKHANSAQHVQTTSKKAAQVAASKISKDTSTRLLASSTAQEYLLLTPSNQTLITAGDSHKQTNYKSFVAATEHNNELIKHAQSAQKVAAQSVKDKAIASNYKQFVADSAPQATVVKIPTPTYTKLPFNKLPKNGKVGALFGLLGSAGTYYYNQGDNGTPGGNNTPNNNTPQAPMPHHAPQSSQQSNLAEASATRNIEKLAQEDTLPTNIQRTLEEPPSNNGVSIVCPAIICASVVAAGYVYKKWYAKKAEQKNIDPGTKIAIATNEKVIANNIEEAEADNQKRSLFHKISNWVTYKRHLHSNYLLGAPAKFIAAKISTLKHSLTDRAYTQ